MFIYTEDCKEFSRVHSTDRVSQTGESTCQYTSIRFHRAFMNHFIFSYDFKRRKETCVCKNLLDYDHRVSTKNKEKCSRIQHLRCNEFLKRKRIS